MSNYTGFSGRASLAAVGAWLGRHGIWEMVESQVMIRQKVVCHTPAEKLLDAFMSMVAGGRGLVEINTLVRPDRALQRAFGRRACAEQSTVSQTINACSAENVDQLRDVLLEILRRHARCCRHDFGARPLLLDIDMTGMPAGRGGEGVTKGYFAGMKNCRGRQLGRVLATDYEEIVADRLFPGKRQLANSLTELVDDAERMLDLNAARRRCTILRIDGGGGNDANIERILHRGYHLLIKVRNWHRARRLARSVRRWFADPKVADRQVGWVEAPHDYGRTTRQIALRKRKKDGSWAYHALVTSLDDATLFRLAGRQMPRRVSGRSILLATLHAYDLRSGGLETQNRADKQGLGLTHRNKRRFVAQEMLVLLAQLAHNVVIWARDSVAVCAGQFAKFGVQRTVRDLLAVPGHLGFDRRGRLCYIALNWRHPFARPLCNGLKRWIGADELLFLLDKT